MNTEIALAYLHFLAIICTAGLLMAELAICRPGAKAEALHRLKNIDVGYAASAAAALGTGVLRLFFGSKGSAYYLANPVFHAKFTLFVLVGLLSIPPTIRFLQWSRSARSDAAFVPPPRTVGRIRLLLWTELAVLSAIPLMATLMAHGVSAWHWGR